MASATLTVGPLPKHVRSIALPMSVGFFFNTMYNVVDSIYAGQVSTTALAAMALSFPVFFVIIAVSEGIARGASALIANAIGAGDGEKERALSGQVFSLGFFCALGLSAVGLMVSEPLFRVLLPGPGGRIHLPSLLGCGLFSAQQHEQLGAARPR
jgi:Na+-driven multidrug efflux pump